MKQQAIQESTRPLIEATERSAQLIRSALKPESMPGNTTLFNRYDTDKNKDKYYSIYQIEDGSFMLGNTQIQIDADNNITIRDQQYPYSKGLWNLLMMNDPADYKPEDLEVYDKIVVVGECVDSRFLRVTTIS